MKDLKLQLIIDALDRATAPLRKVSDALSKVGERAEKLKHSLHKLGLAEFIGGAFFTGVGIEAGRGILELADKFSEAGEAALKQSKQTGASMQAMQQWTWAAKQMNVESESVVRGFGMMEFHLSQALSGNKESIRSLGLLGISLKEIKALSSDPSALFGRMLEGFGALRTDLDRARVGREIFGRGWSELAPLIKAPREEIEEMMDQLKRAHVLMTEKDGKAAEDFARAKRNMGLAIEGLSIRIGRALIPSLTNAIKKVTDWIESLKEDAIQTFADAIGTLAKDFTDLLPSIERLVPKVIHLIDKILGLLKHTKALKLAFGALVTFLAVQAAVALIGTAASILNIGTAAFSAAAMIVGLIPEIAGLTDVMALLDLAMDANPIGVLALAIGALLAAIVLLGLAFYWLAENWKDVVRGIEDGCKKIESAFTSLDKSLPSWARVLLQAGAQGISLMFPTLGALGAAIDGVAHAPRPDGPGTHGPTPLAYPRFGAPHRSARADHLGTITVKAEAGTKVTKMAKSGDVDLVHRGVIGS